MILPDQPAVSKRQSAFQKDAARTSMAALIVLVSLGLALAFQWPTIRQAFPGGDDSGYLFDGVRFVEQGVWMPLGSGPLAGMTNAAIYAFFPRDHMLLGEVSAVRRAILLVAILAAVGIAVSAMGGRRAGLVAMGLAAIARPVSTVLENSADALYTAFAGLSFAFFVWAWPSEGTDRVTSRWKLGLSGVLLGIAALARLDGLLLGCVLILGLWILRGRQKIALKETALFAAGIAVPLCVYLLAYGIATGRWDPQLGQRSYLAFAQGHNFLYSGRYDIEPTPSASDLYGSAEQNGNSVPRAILNNPRAFFARVPLVLANAVRMFYNAYSIIGGLLFLFFVAAGLAVHDRKQADAVRLLPLLWCAPLAGYLLASYRPGFFGTVFPELLTLAMLGALPVWRTMQTLFVSTSRPVLAVWVLVAIGAIASQIQFVWDQTRGWDAQQRVEANYRGVLQELESQVPEGACMITYDAASAIYSNHVAYSEWTIFSITKTPDELRQAMETGNCPYLVAGEGMREAAPDFLALAERTLLPVYTSIDHSWMIYRLPR